MNPEKLPFDLNSVLSGQKKFQPMHDKALKHLASSIYRQLQEEGCHAKDIIGVSTQLLSLVTHELGTHKAD